MDAFYEKEGNFNLWKVEYQGYYSADGQINSITGP